MYNKMAMSREEISYYFGALMNYCVPEVFEGEILTTYHIDLLSAHFGGSSGKMWVKYGYSHFDQAHDLQAIRQHRRDRPYRALEAGKAG